jgi:Zn ribbon nucleic-acid-binding protein
LNQFCPRCGAQFAPDVNVEFSSSQVLCVECGLSMEDPPELLAPSDNDDDQIAYDLVEWPPEDRTIATADLVELGIPYRWEDNLVLVVPAGVEEQVDAVLDEIDENALGDDEEDLSDALLLEDNGEDGGEEAAEAMSDLFIAADALQHGAYDDQRVVEFMEAAAAAAQCLPPYGIEPQVWTRVQNSAAAIVSALEKGEDEESTMEAAAALRNLLRQYV